MKHIVAFIAVARHLFGPFASLKEVITFLQEAQINLSENRKVLDVSVQLTFLMAQNRLTSMDMVKYKFLFLGSSIGIRNPVYNETDLNLHK